MLFVTCSQQKQNNGCIFIHYYSGFTFTSRVGALVGSVHFLVAEVPPPPHHLKDTIIASIGMM